MAPGEWGAQMLLRNAARRREDHVFLHQAALRHEEDVMYAFMRYCNANGRRPPSQRELRDDERMG